MESNHFKTVTERIKADLGPDYIPLGYSRAMIAIVEQKNKTKEVARRAEDYKKALIDKGFSRSEILADPKLGSLLDTFEKESRTLKDMETALDTGAVFDSMLPGENASYIACESSISLADVYDIRHEIPGSALRFVVENYDDNTSAYIVGEGETIGEHDLFDSVHTFDAKSTSCKKVASILNSPETAFDDDPILRDSAVYNVQAKHTKTGENALLLDMILESKEAVPVTVETLFADCNETLSANARRRAEIITNESGFAKLDTENKNGEPYIKKNFEIGEFVFRDRYIVRVLPDELLPDFEDESSPVLVGDWANVLRLAVILKYPPADAKGAMTDLYNGITKNKAVERVIPVLTTESDKAYFVGYIVEEVEGDPETVEDNTQGNDEQNNG